MAREGTTRIDIVVVVLVLIAIIVSAGTLFYVTDVTGKTDTLTDDMVTLTNSVMELTSSVGDLADAMIDLAETIGAYAEDIATIQQRISEIETSLKPLMRGYIVLGTTDSISTLDPSWAYDFYTWEVFNNIGEGLLKYIPGTTEIEFGIAENYTVSPDGLNYTFKLRPGMKFTDGEPLDAAAVKWSVDRVMTIEGPPSWLVSAFVNRTEVVDTLTVRFVLQEPISYFPAIVALCPTYYPVSSESFPAAETDEPTVGHYGPYKIKKWTRDVELVLEANPDYLGIPPESKTFVVKFFKDAATMRMAVETGEIDIAWRTLRPMDVVDLKAKGVLTIEEVPGPYIRYIVCRCHMEPWNNTDLRRAIAYAIDRDRICTEAWLGTVDPLYSMVPMGMWSQIDAFQEEYGARNLTLAREILTAAGYSETNKFAFDLWYTPTHYGDPEVLVASIIKESLEETGMITVTLKSAEWATYASVYIPEATMPLFLLGWYPDYIDPDNYLTPFLHSEWSFANGVYYNNTQMDTYLDDAMVELNLTRRTELYVDAQELMAEEAPVIPFFQGILNAAYWPNVGGIVLDPTMILRYYLIYKV